MIVKASGRPALILATALFVCFAGPSQAAAGTDDAADDATASSKPEHAAGAAVVRHRTLRHSARHWKHYAHAKSRKVALKPAESKKAAATDAAADNRADLPMSVANANALAFPGMPDANTRAMSVRANDLVQAASDDPADVKADNKAGNETLVVAADQLSDVDRTLREGNTATVVASANPPAAPVASSQESSTWDETSLIGRIFIGFGALLTMASAARMFMA